MPNPRPGEETRDEYLERCIPVVLDDGTAKDNDQAVAVCSSYWDDASKKTLRLRRKAAPVPGDETRDEFMERCVPMALDDGVAESDDQAASMCATIWDKAGEKKAAPPTIVRRAYGLLEVKNVDNDRRIVQGIATTPSPDRMGDVVDPMGAKFALPIPLLYQHSSALPVGEVFEARPTKDGINVKARIFKAMESRTLKERLDEAWESVKIGLLKGFSIGFAPLGPPELIEKTAGYRYALWEWLELSLVTIPANAEASIQNVKSLYRATYGSDRVVKLDNVTLTKARRIFRPGVVYLDKVTK